MSPALIAMAAVDLKLKKDGHRCRQLHPQIFNSLRALLEATLPAEELKKYLGADPEALWLKLESVEAKLEANKSDKKTGSKIMKLLERKQTEYKEMMAYMETIRVEELNQIEPAGVWDDLED